MLSEERLGTPPYWPLCLMIVSKTALLLGSSKNLLVMAASATGVRSLDATMAEMRWRSTSMVRLQ